MPPGTPKTRLIRSGGSRMPCSSQRTALTTWPTSKHSTSRRDPGACGPLDDPAACRRRRDEGLVAEVHRARLDPGDVRLGLEPGRALLDRHLVGAAGRDHREDLAAGADPVDHIDEQLRPAARRAVVLAHVQVGDRRARRRGLDRRVGDLGGRVGDVRVVVAEDVGAGDGDGDHGGLLVPGAAHPGSPSDRQRTSRSASLIGRMPRTLADPRARARTRPRPDGSPPASEDPLAGRQARAAELAHRALDVDRALARARSPPASSTEQRPTTYSSRPIPCSARKASRPSSR